MTAKLFQHLLSMLSGTAILIGCETTTITQTGPGDRPMPPSPRHAPETPNDVTPDRIVLQVAAKPRDTNGNRYPDEIEVLANLFSNDHAMPFYADGTFVFTLYPDGRSGVPDARPIRVWRIAGDELEAAKGGRSLYGLTYRFTLSLLENGGDQFPLISADLACRFEPADGSPPVIRKEIHKMQIGAHLSR